MIKAVVVEDNRGLRVVYARILQAAGIFVETAEEGAAGFELVERMRPHVVVSDICMPLVDGFELAHRIRTQSCHTDVAILAVTAAYHNSVVERAKAVGFDAVLFKPVDARSLQESVTSLAMRLENRRVLPADSVKA